MGISGEFNVALMHHGIRSNDTGRRALVRLDSYTSRIAIKGSEEFGGGLRADFLLGSGFRVDEGRGMFCNRECWLGLRGTLGALRIGRTLTIYDDVSLAWYFQDSPGVHNPITLWANCGNNAGVAAGCFDVFLPRTARYDSPVAQGVSVSLSVSDPSRELPANRQGRIVAAGAEYRNDSFYAAIARQSNRGTRSDGLVDEATTLSFSWKGFVTLSAGLERIRYAVESGGSLSRDYVGLMASRAVRAHTIWGNFGRAYRGVGSSGSGSRVNAVQNLAESGALMWTLGYQYKLSQRTRFYLFRNRLDNERNGLYTFDPALAPRTGEGSRMSAWAFGMQKRF